MEVKQYVCTFCKSIVQHSFNSKICPFCEVESGLAESNKTVLNALKRTSQEPPDLVPTQFRSIATKYPHWESQLSGLLDGPAKKYYMNLAWRSDIISVFDHVKEKTVKVIKTLQEKLNVLSIKGGLQHTAEKQFIEAFEKRMMELERTISNAIFGGKVFIQKKRLRREIQILLEMNQRYLHIGDADSFKVYDNLYELPV